MSTEINNVNHNLNVIITLTLICVNTYVCGVTVNEAKKVLEHKWSEVRVSENIAERITIITFISNNINFPNIMFTRVSDIINFIIL